jgi:tetratricopeptide (TPR) repeat protein
MNKDDAMRYVRPEVPGFVLVVAVMVGCAPKEPPPTIVDAVNAYRGGQYEAAYEQSAKLAHGAGSTDQAIYMAGMSAYRLGRDDEALRHLGKLTDHKDDGMAGPANATIGLIMAKRGQHDRALRYFEQAVPRLKGNDQAQAQYHMGLTLQRLGKWAQARPPLILAASNATDADLKAAAEHRVRTAGFTLQFGAFRVQKSAQEQARNVSPLTQRAGIGPARVVSQQHRGHTLYHVQAGTFGTHEAALHARQRLNRPDVSVERLIAE